MGKTSTKDYSAPEIVGRRDLSASMMPETKSMILPSDADVKHGVTSVKAYETPQITEERPLSGLTECCSDVS